MKTRLKLKLHFLLLALLSGPVLARAQGNAFNYQGRLLDNGIAANGSYDFVFTVHDAEVDGNAVGAPLTLDAIAVSAGQFAVPLDFGPAVFTGPARWLRIGVRIHGAVEPHTTLAPQQALVPTPYAIFAGSAGSVADGTVTANQLNTGGVVPTPGQFLSYDGGNLLWSDPGVAVGDVWSRNGADAYFNAGKVGIGTMAPTTPVEANGIVRSTRSGVAPQYIQLNGGDSGSIKLTAQSTLAAEKNLFIENLSGEATPGANNNIQFVLGTAASRSTKMTITKDGNLLLPLEGSGGGITFGTPNFETGMSIVGAVGRADLRFDGTTVKLVAGPVGAPPSSAYGIAINTSGNVGIGTAPTSGAKLKVVTAVVGGIGTPPAILAQHLGNGTGIHGSANSRTGVAGSSTSGTGVSGFSTSGDGVVATSTSGKAIIANGNVQQTREKGGFVKAMIFVKADGTIVRGFNSFLDSDSATTPPCGFSVQTLPYQGGIIGYVIDFGFRIDDRFVSVTPSPGANAVVYGDTPAGPNPNKLWLAPINCDFTVIVY